MTSYDSCLGTDVDIAKDFLKYRNYVTECATKLRPISKVDRFLKAYSNLYNPSLINEDTFVKNTSFPIFETQFPNSSCIQTERQMVLKLTHATISASGNTYKVQRIVSKHVEEKTEGRNPNAGRETNGTKAFSNGEFMIACGDKNSTVVSDSKNIIVDKPNH
ncbi:hypothetical protein BDC45DRAFT_536425 [Circinella umbellata]|nr:hypothetical protein BDC45DRAFT_536425 [Circinella umbellata]